MLVQSFFAVIVPKIANVTKRANEMEGVPLKQNGNTLLLNLLRHDCVTKNSPFMVAKYI